MRVRTKTCPYVGVYQVGAYQDVEVGGPAEGAAAVCGGGESHHVGDRSRADCGGPVEADVGVVGGSGRCVVGLCQSQGRGVMMARCLAVARRDSRQHPSEALIPQRRTAVSWVLGCCRDLIHDTVITNIVKQRQVM